MSDRKEYLKKYRLEHKEKYKEYQRKYMKNHLSTYELLKKENQLLKKQLEERILESSYFDMITDENIIFKNQQKEFISYLENEMKSWTEALNEEHDYELVQEFSFKCNTYEEILSKFKEIIGVSNES